MHLQSLKLVVMFNLGVEATQSVAQYPLHHMTHAPAKFEAVTANCLGGDAQYLTLTLGIIYFLRYINLENASLRLH